VTIWRVSRRLASADFQASLTGSSAMPVSTATSRAILEQPQIDVVEGEGQRHAQPLDAGRDDRRGAGRGSSSWG